MMLDPTVQMMIVPLAATYGNIDHGVLDSRFSGWVRHPDVSTMQHHDELVAAEPVHVGVAEVGPERGRDLLQDCVTRLQTMNVEVRLEVVHVDAQEAVFVHRIGRPARSPGRLV